MNFDYDILTYSEGIIFDLRSLYSKAGYMPFKVSRFEQYELYAENRSFLPSDDIIAFTDTGGRLMALRPDVTLSIVKSIKNDKELKKLYYNENVYRTINGELKEQMQVGIECIGQIDTEQVAEIITLATQSLNMLGRKKARLYVSHMGYLRGLINSEPMTSIQSADILQCINDKNISGLKNVCDLAGVSDNYFKRLNKLVVLSGTIDEIKIDLEELNINDETNKALCELLQLNEKLKDLDVCSDIYADFSVINNIAYYSGIIFQGFIEGIPEKILSGGRYDELLSGLGKCGGAVGFAINVDLASSLDPKITFLPGSVTAEKMLGVALPKGRLGESALEMLKKAGIECPDINNTGRKLVLEDTKNNIRFFWVKPSDVAIYVERGAADIGVVGKDTLLETDPDVFELLDLKLGNCRMCVASTIGFNLDYHDKVLKVATKFPNITREYFSARGIDVDIIKLQGSIELAPLLGLSDVIVDLVETGKTLTDNNMEVIETIVEISARLIANKASYKFKRNKIDTICCQIGGTND